MLFHMQKVENSNDLRNAHSFRIVMMSTGKHLFLWGKVNTELHLIFANS